jgi:hypothetical protein
MRIEDVRKVSCFIVVSKSSIIGRVWNGIMAFAWLGKGKGRAFIQGLI